MRVVVSILKSNEMMFWNRGIFLPLEKPAAARGVKRVEVRA